MTPVTAFCTCSTAVPLTSPAAGNAPVAAADAAGGGRHGAGRLAAQVGGFAEHPDHRASRCRGQVATERRRASDQPAGDTRHAGGRGPADAGGTLDGAGCRCGDDLNTRGADAARTLDGALNRLSGRRGDIAAHLGGGAHQATGRGPDRGHGFTADLLGALQHAEDRPFGRLAQIAATRLVPLMRPLATSVTVSVSAFPTAPVPRSAVASEPLTVSVTALTISPVPRMVPTMVFVTFSTSALMTSSLGWSRRSPGVRTSNQTRRPGRRAGVYVREGKAGGCSTSEDAAPEVTEWRRTHHPHPLIITNAASQRSQAQPTGLVYSSSAAPPHVTFNSPPERP